MEINCLACARDGGCFEATAIDDVVILRISGSVGAGGMNKTPDVSIIQKALNDISAEDGGAAAAPLKVDGIAGTLTRTAITRYQQKNVTIIDGRVDPNGPTIRAMNESLGGGGVDIVAAGSGAGVAKGGKSPFQPLDPKVVTKIVGLLAKIRVVIRAANFQLDLASPFIGTKKIVKPTGLFQAPARLALNLLDAVFDLGKLSNPSPSFHNIRTAYKNMDVALNRSFETNPLIAPILFVPNKFVVMETKAAAYTSAGGAFLSSKARLKKLGVPADRIYLCNNLLNESEIHQVSVVVHELAHFVSGRPFLIDDQVKTGRMLNSASKPSFDALKPEQKIRSAEHYAFFAVLAGFRRLD